MIDFTKRQLEDLAHSFVERYYAVQKKRGIRKVEKIEPRIMLLDVLGLDIQYHTLSLDGSIIGYTIGSQIEMEVFDTGSPVSVPLDGNTVFIESKLRRMNKGRENFTIMHEGAHQIFFKLFPAYYNCGVRVLRCNSNGEISAEDCAEEYQADYLASALLMPREIVIAGLERYYRIKQYGSKKHYVSWDKESFKKVADYLGVSKQALRIRIGELGIIIDRTPSFIVEYED